MPILKSGSFLFVLILGMSLLACEPSANREPSVNMAASAATDASSDPSLPLSNPTPPKSAATKAQGLQNPNWRKVQNLPSEWGGLYQKDCVIGGPETSSYFSYRDSQKNAEHYLSYTVFPASLNKSPKADIVSITYQIWQNENWPDHYLLFGLNSFKQILIEDGWSHGVHQTLDGKAWDGNANWNTRYRSTDMVRWAVDMNNEEDYGSRPACNLNLAASWVGVKFISKAGKSTTLDALIGAK